MRKDDEYAAMRATIRERGTARMVLVPLIFIGWAATAIATAAVITVALSTLVPLIILAAGFEAVFALHVNVERIGRYLQVFHEPDDGLGARRDAVRPAISRDRAGPALQPAFPPGDLGQLPAGRARRRKDSSWSSSACCT